MSGSDPFTKGQSPFFPGRPVPAELFVGRRTQIEYILERGAGQVALGKPIAMFVRGEYGIGKSSIATYCQRAAESKLGLHPIYASLGGVSDLDEIGERILEATVRSGAFEPTRGVRIRNWLSKYVGEQELFGLKIRADELKKDAPSITSGLLAFLGEVVAQLAPTGIKGVFLVLDEINGITAEPRFAHYLKTLVDTNAIAPKPVPVLLMLCGVETRRRELIQHHQPVDRIFDIVDIDKMSEPEMAEFFRRAFDSVRMRVDSDAMWVLTHFSGGVPKIMHLVGDQAYWLADTDVVTQSIANRAVIHATESFGKQFLHQQVYSELRSEAYRRILQGLVAGPLEDGFRRAAVMKALPASESTKFDNFIQRMKSLNVIHEGESRGDWRFHHPMIGLYIWMRSQERVPGESP